MASGTVSGIFVHPVKSCRAVALDSTTVTAIGLADDRMWQFVDASGDGVTQRQHRVLATVQPEIHSGGLRLTAPSMPPIDVVAGGDVSTVKSVFGVPVGAVDAGDAVAAWFTGLTGDAGRLVAMADAAGWRLPGDYDLFDQNAPFSDAAPVLVTSQSSLDRLRADASEDFGMDRFRPNIVVSGGEPWEEDTWESFHIGAAELGNPVPWPRCTIPQIDQTNAERRHEPAKVLRRHRWCTDGSAVPGPFRQIVEGSALFGIGCSIGPVGATIRVGDPVTVATRRSPILAMSD